ncbi:hypothetical protein ACPOL_2361 [Acidisarcina polymorpha]|uniref:Porin n=2 Tax=Acidisarcina polymorpha TaxID=2211140 RepID=A0A2Z5FZ51_9BACT|nr:hypothetical protein ACPOL_2361 [Acidisarcina polymorpha]
MVASAQSQGAGASQGGGRGNPSIDVQGIDVQALREEMRAMESQMELLQNNLNRMRAKLDAVGAAASLRSGGAVPGPGVSGVAASGAAAAADSQTALAQPPPPAPKEKRQMPAPREMISQELSAAPRIDNAPYGTESGEIMIPGTEIGVRLGGFARVDMIRDLKPAGFATGFIPSTIPIGPTLAGDDTRLDINQSRISMDIRRPTRFGTLRVFYANDFFGGTTSDPIYHLRDLYGQVANVLAGYTDSTFLDVDATPETLDNQGPNGNTTGSAAQVRYTHPFGRGHSLAIGAEGAVVDVDASPDDAQFTSQIPDIALRYRYEAEKGHFQFSSIFRDIQGNVGGLIHPHVFGWGVTAAGTRTMFSRDTALFQFTYGSGIGHYLSDLVGEGSDVTIDGDGELVTLPALGGFGGYQHSWNARSRSTLTYGYTKIDNTSAQDATAFHSSHYAALNYIWNLDKTISFGGEFLYGRHTQFDRTAADATRLQLSIQYDLFPSER